MTFLGGMKMNDQEKIDQEKLEKEKFEKEYERLLEKFLFGKLGVTKENSKKYEEAKSNYFILENLKEYFVCCLMFYFTYLSQAKIFLEVGDSPLHRSDLFCDLRDSFREVTSVASCQKLTEEEEKEISGILIDVFPEYLSVSYNLRKKNYELIRRKKWRI